MKLPAAITRWGIVATLCTIGAGCANFPPQPFSWSPPAPVVTGTVFYREVGPLPANATVQVRLLESSGAGAPDTVVGEQTISSICNRFIDPPCNGPVFYQLSYDAAKLDPSREYLVAAQILDGDKAIFRSTTPNRALTGGHPQSIQVLVAKEP